MTRAGRPDREADAAFPAGAARRASGWRLFCCLAWCLAWCDGVHAVAAHALPEAPNVRSGRASIASDPEGMRIVQTSEHAVVDWRTFDIGPLVSLRVVQPAATAALLNRVTGATPSVLAGGLEASGRVFLINPNGIHLTSTALIEAGSFVASTLDIANDDFAAGVLRFGAARRPGQGHVTHAGVITIDPGGFVALLGERVTHSGRTGAPGGQVALGAGVGATLALGRLPLVRITPAANEANGTNGTNGTPADAATNAATSAAMEPAAIVLSGTIEADGGFIHVCAPVGARPGRIPGEAVRIDGLARARRGAGVSGRVLVEGRDGVVRLSGVLDASSAAVERDLPRGGTVEVRGLQVMVERSGIVANGTGGGGRVVLAAVSRDAAGDVVPAPHDAYGPLVFVGSAAGIDANATCRGTGGEMVLVSDGPVVFLGTHRTRSAEPTTIR